MCTHATERYEGTFNKRLILCILMLIPRLSPRANEKSKERGEPGRIYHVRNVIGRENLITCGQTNELAHTVRTEYSCDSFMADRMGLDALCYIAWQYGKLW